MVKERSCVECGNSFSSPRRRKYCSATCAFWHGLDRGAGPDACWPWRGNRTRDGYGNVPDSLADGRRTSAHRRAYRLHYEVDPGPLYVLHRCDNPACANPVHLFLGTQKDNMLDAFLKGRPIVSAPGAANRHAKLSEEEVLEIRESQRRDADLARLFGVHRATVRAARTGATWRHVRHELPAEDELLLVDEA
jgi:hypothetical protein